MTAYYNEFDPGAAAWLRELIKQGHIAPGEVDERSIEDVHPGDLRGFTQCHFFAGIGGWSLALRRAGWADDRPVWTGSCPCQPFSSAGKGLGEADERHLWPAFFHLIEQCRPAIAFGEQVASADGIKWLDLVSADLERAGYTCGSAVLPACGVGAPHIRQRLYWVADASIHGPQGWIPRGPDEGWADKYRQAGRNGAIDRLEPCGFCGYQFDHDKLGKYGCPNCEGEGLGGFGRVANVQVCGRGEKHQDARGIAEGDRAEGVTTRFGAGGGNLWSGPTNGHWRAADWLGCRDGKWRPVEPGTFPLAHGIPARVGRLRGYGNAIVPQVAEAFIRAFVG